MIQGYYKINICPICGSKVGNKNFSRHLKSHVTDHICELCNSKYSRKDHLKRHIRSFHDRVLFTCLNCSKSFKFEEGLRKHSQRRRCKQGKYNSIFLVNTSVSDMSNISSDMTLSTYILRDIKKIVTTVLESIFHDQSDGSDVVVSGCAIIFLFKHLTVILGSELLSSVNDILESRRNRCIHGEVKEFVGHVANYENLSTDKGRSMLTNSLLEKSLQLKSISSSLNEVTGEANKIVKDDKSKEDSTVTEQEKIDIEGNCKEDQSKAEYYFHKFSPLKPDKKIEVACGECNKILSSTRTFVAHVKRYHEDSQYFTTGSFKEKVTAIKCSEKGTCRLPAKDLSANVCGLKFTTDQFKKHFKVKFTCSY